MLWLGALARRGVGGLVAVLIDAGVAADADSFRKAFSRLAIAVGIGATVLFLVFPEIDLLAAKAFYLGDGHFSGKRAGGVAFLRWFFVCLYFSCIGLAIAGIMLSRVGRRPWMGLTLGRWLFVVACLSAGPGLVANVLLKDQWGRARPAQVVEFGGHKAFTAALVPSRQCPRNCSFVSGEASSVFVLFFAAALIIPQWSISLAAAGTLGGLAAGVIRMSQGAHFLSDVIFAGVFMALTVLAIHKLMLGYLHAVPSSGASMQQQPIPTR
jgi:lipid A 4'-phosphatase